MTRYLSNQKVTTNGVVQQRSLQSCFGALTSTTFWRFDSSVFCCGQYTAYNSVLLFHVHISFASPTGFAWVVIHLWPKCRNAFFTWGIEVWLYCRYVRTHHTVFVMLMSAQPNNDKLISNKKQHDWDSNLLNSVAHSFIINYPYIYPGSMLLINPP